MFRIQLDAGWGRAMVIELRGGLIHYFNEPYGMLAIMGPLQPGEVPIPEETLKDFILLEGEEHE